MNLEVSENDRAWRKESQRDNRKREGPCRAGLGEKAQENRKYQ